MCALYAASVLLPLVGCDKLDFGTDPVYPKQREQTVAGSESPVQDPSSDRSLIGDLFSDDTPETLMIPVNGLLWRASLDTLSFMPLSSADPFGGVIITDWYSPPDTPEERFKVTAYILARTLKSDGIRIAVFRQARSESGDWNNVPVNETVASDLENAILKNSVLLDANLDSANLTNADLRNTLLADANLSNAILKRADLSNAVLTGVILAGADLENAILIDTILNCVGHPICTS